jgi:glycosyltransferase involved in cell wall biosynthesis
MNKKLVYILNSYSHSSDQHYFHVINLLEEIANLGVEISLIIEKCDGLPNIISNNIKVYSLTQRTKFLRPFHLFYLLLKLHSKGYLKIFTRISNSAIIISIIVSFFKKNIETYYWHSGTVFEFNRKVKSKKELFKDNLIFNFIKRNVDHFVTGPESMKKYYVETCKVYAEKILILYNDVDLNRFSSEDTTKSIYKNELGVPFEESVILFVHRLSPVRETLFYIPYVIEKFYDSVENNNFKFYIIGGGKDKEKLDKLLAENPLKDKIKLLGSKPNSIIQKYYRIADIFINPTMAEGFPRVILEAEAMALPIVSTDAGGIRDIVPDIQQPFIVDKKDRDAFVNALINLCKDEDKRKLLGSSNKLYVEKFSTLNIAKMYVNKIFNDHE